MKRVVVALLLFSVLLSGCGTFEVYFETTPAGDTALPEAAATTAPTLSINSSSEEIQRLMLESATKWKSLWMDGTVTNYALDGTDSQTTREQVWIDLTTNRFRVLTGSREGSAEQYLTSDGLAILKLDLKTGRSESQPMPEFARVGQFVPTLEPGSAYPQPLWGQMGTPLSQLAFTSDFAQNEGRYQPTGTEIVAGREALIVEWTFVDNELPSWRMWLDTKTAVILKMQTFDKSGGDTVRSESVVNQVRFDDVFANSLFGIPASVPQFSDVKGQPVESVETGADVATGRDALGELYFFTLPHQANQTAQLVRLPGLCVVGQAACPQAERVTPPFPFNVSLTPLAWSPDGTVAAFAYPEYEKDTPYKLWLFDPVANTWTSLFEYAYIDPPFWSPDGKWIAFRVQDGLGGEDVYVVHPDGSELKNLTASVDLLDDGKPYVMDGWVTGNILVRSAKPGKEGTVYLVRVADGHVQPMFDTLLIKSQFVPSHQGAWLAYDDYDGQQHAIRVMEPDGANPLLVTSLTGGSIYPIVWSPDDQRLAFVYSNDFTQDGAIRSEIYIVDRTGKNLKQVYRGTTIGSLLFSPDGEFLLVSETDRAIGAQFSVINVESSQLQMIQAPGLGLNMDWVMPAWRK